MNFLTTHFPLEVPFSESLFLLRWPLLLIKMKSPINFQSSPHPYVSTKGLLWRSFSLPEPVALAAGLLGSSRRSCAGSGAPLCPSVPLCARGWGGTGWQRFPQTPSCRGSAASCRHEPSQAPGGKGHMTSVRFLPTFLTSPAVALGSGRWGGEQISNLTRKTLLLYRCIPWNSQCSVAFGVG